MDNHYSSTYYDLNASKATGYGPTSTVIRRVTLIIGIITVGSTAFVVGAPYWRVSYSLTTVALISQIWEYEGIFLTCLNQGAQGISQCYQLYPIMGTTDCEAGVRSGSDCAIYPYLNAYRALMLIALVFSVAGVVLSALGMRCTSALKEDSAHKRWVIVAGGFCHIITGALTCISVSWYAAEVVAEYYSPLYANQRMKYTLGACLYVGWISMVFSLVCGLLMVCCTCCNKSADTAYEYTKNTYAYEAPVAQEKYAPKPIYKKSGKSNGRSSSSHWDSYSHHSHKKDWGQHESSSSSSTRSLKSSYQHNDATDAMSGYV